MKIRINDGDSNRWALTIAKNGKIISTTTNQVRSADFTEAEATEVALFYSNQKAQGREVPNVLYD